MMSHRLSVLQVEEAHAVGSPEFTHTPQYICEPLSSFFNLHILGWLKSHAFRREL